MLRHSNNKRNRKTSQHTFTLTSNHFDQLTWPKFPFILQILYSSFYDIIIVKNIINKMLMKLLWIFSALMKKKKQCLSQFVSPQMYHKKILFLLCCMYSNIIFVELVILSLKRKSKLCLICCWNCGSCVTWMQLCK